MGYFVTDVGSNPVHALPPSYEPSTCMHCMPLCYEPSTVQCVHACTAALLSQIQYIKLRLYTRRDKLSCYVEIQVIFWDSAWQVWRNNVLQLAMMLSCHDLSRHLTGKSPCRSNPFLYASYLTTVLCGFGSWCS